MHGYEHSYDVPEVGAAKIQLKTWSRRARLSFDRELRTPRLPPARSAFRGVLRASHRRLRRTSTKQFDEGVQSCPDLSQAHAFDAPTVPCGEQPALRKKSQADTRAATGRPASGVAASETGGFFSGAAPSSTLSTDTAPFTPAGEDDIKLGAMLWDWDM